MDSSKLALSATTNDRLKRLQAVTGLIIAAFLALHLSNTVLAIFGPEVYDSVQSLFRLVYQLPVLEATLLLAIAVHAVVGAVRWRRERSRPRTAAARWHRYAGLFLLIFIVGHVFATRGADWFYDVSPGFAGLSFTLNALPAYFYPYYWLLGLAGFYHGLRGVPLALRRVRAPAAGFARWLSPLPSRALAISSGIAAIALLAALTSLGGLWFDIADPQANPYAELVRRLTGG